MRSLLLGTMVLAIAVFAVTIACHRVRDQQAERRATTHLVLIGASIGRGWNLDGWPERMRERAFSAEALAVWKFDKTEAVEEVLLRPARRFQMTRTYVRSLFRPAPPVPRVVILKECSAYFPGDLTAYQALTRTWVEKLRRRGVRILLATAVPVTHAKSDRYPRKQESLLEYNCWLREFAREQGAGVLDLERALADGAPGSFLPDKFAAPDGTHLNRAGYEVLDRALLAALRTAGFADSLPRP